MSKIPQNISIWTGNKGTTTWSDCGNWEGGLIPGPTSTVIVYGHAKPYPIVDINNTTVNKVNLLGGNLTVNPGINFIVLSQ